MFKPSARWLLLPALAAAMAVVGSRPPEADSACCYFSAKDKDILQPAQKVFITWDPVEKIESFTVQPKFEGNALDFGMVIPTPARPKLDEMPRDFFTDLALYTILMPLPVPIWPELGHVRRKKNGGGRPAFSAEPSSSRSGHGVTV